jgi:tRNA pseudouridine32 synthase/23S rRNA pseudouridine746 synthase
MNDSTISLDLVADHNGQSAMELLCTASGLSKQRIKDAMNKGAVWWTRKGKTLRLRRATQLLDKGVKLQLFYNPQLLALKPSAPELLSDQRRYSVWYKPHGLMSQGSQWGDHCSLLRWVEVNGQPRREVYLVHRLDADAAGIMLVAHDPQSAAKLSQLFQSRDIRKHYQARVTGELAVGSSLSIDQPLDGKSAITHLTCLGYDPETRISLLDIRIETGRKHQIRRHLADQGFAIVGDRLYGKASAEPLQLLAYRLTFSCPFSQQLIDIQLPDDKHFSLSS